MMVHISPAIKKTIEDVEFYMEAQPCKNATTEASTDFTQITRDAWLSEVKSLANLHVKTLGPCPFRKTRKGCVHIQLMLGS